LHDGGMPQPGHRVGLPGEAQPALLLGREVGVQDLDRHVALEEEVAGEVHHSHPTAADGLDELVPIEAPSPHPCTGPSSPNTIPSCRAIRTSSPSVSTKRVFDEAARGTATTSLPCRATM